MFPTETRPNEGAGSMPRPTAAIMLQNTLTPMDNALFQQSLMHDVLRCMFSPAPQCSHCCASQHDKKRKHKLRKKWNNHNNSWLEPETNLQAWAHLAGASMLLLKQVIFGSWTCKVGDGTCYQFITEFNQAELNSLKLYFDPEKVIYFLTFPGWTT